MSQRILVVEDQEDLRAILRDFLSASAIRGWRWHCCVALGERSP